MATIEPDTIKGLLQALQHRPTPLIATSNGEADMSGRGTRIVFASSGNFTGENPDGNPEVFLFDSTTGAFTFLFTEPATIQQKGSTGQ